MSIDIMLDLETLATTPDSVILSFAAVKFNPFSLDEEDDYTTFLNLKLDIDQQISLNRKVDDSTIEWWAKQDPAIREFAFDDNNRTAIADFIIALNKFVVAADRIWAQGPVFDIVILENLYRQIGYPIPWPYYTIRDSRTLIKALGYEIVHNRSDAHDALADCKYQAGYIKKITNRYNLQQL
jgi:hypothetical protein